MRCPKCGFISFDRLDKCLKCNKSFGEAAALVLGTVHRVAAPAFLRIEDKQEAKSFGADIEISDAEETEFELQDPDLDILLEEEAVEAEAVGAQESFLQLEKEIEGSSANGDFALSIDSGKEEEDDNLAIDLGQFHNDLEEADLSVEPKTEEKVTIEFPDELADISDLAPPPPPPPPQKKAAPPPVSKQPEEEFDFSLDLGLDETNDRSGGSAGKAPKNDSLDFSFDLDLDDLGGGKAAAKKPPEDDVLDLGGLDLGPVKTQKSPAKSSKKPIAESSGMDEELNFDLDLGGLSLDKD